VISSAWGWVRSFRMSSLSAKAISLAALILLAFTVGRSAEAWTANFAGGAFWKNAGWNAMHPVQVGAGGPIMLVNLVVILAVVQVGSLFSADAWNNITFTAGEVKNPKRNLPLSADSGHRVCARRLLSGFAGLPAGASSSRRSRTGQRWRRGAFSMRLRTGWRRRCWDRFSIPAGHG